LPPHGGGQLLREEFRVDADVSFDVANAKAAAQVELPGDKAEAPADLVEKAEHHLDGRLKRPQVENLRTDVTVKAGELHPLQGERPAGGLVGLAAGEAEAELRIDLPGLDVRVGVGFDARGDPEEDRGPGAGAPGERVQKLQFVQVVDDDPVHPVLEGHLQLFGRFVVPVEDDAVRRKAREKRRVELAAGDDVEVEAFFFDDAADGGGEQRFTRVDHFEVGIGAGKPLDVRPGLRAQVRLVQDVKGRAEAPGELHRVASPDEEVVFLHRHGAPELQSTRASLIPLRAGRLAARSAIYALC